MNVKSLWMAPIGNRDDSALVVTPSIILEHALTAAHGFMVCAQTVSGVLSDPRLLSCGINQTARRSLSARDTSTSA